MTTSEQMKVRIQDVLEAANDLRDAMQGEVHLFGDDGYEASRQIWNGAVGHLPLVIALCETVQDVQAAVRVSRLHGLPLSVRGGGHDFAGRALRHEGLVINLTKMRQIQVDPMLKVATVGGGATANDLMKPPRRMDSPR